MKYKKLLINFFKKPIFAHLDSVRLVQIVLLLALIGIISFFKLSFNFSGYSSSNLATLAINFETEKRFFEGEVVKDMTVLDALSAAVSVGKIRFNYAIDKSDNVNIMEIDNHANGISKKYFVFYLNSQKVATKDLNKKVIHGGDRIEIRNE